MKAARRSGCMGEAIMKFSLTAASAALLFIASAAFAADYPAPKQGDWIARDFRFHTGETVQELPPVVAIAPQRIM